MSKNISFNCLIISSQPPITGYVTVNNGLLAIAAPKRNKIIVTSSVINIFQQLIVFQN